MAEMLTGQKPIIDVTGNRLLPIGSEDFAEVASQRVYVDKSLLIRELIDSASKVTLFCRPRRFGKSLAMRMLQCYFEVPVAEGRIPDRHALFAPLAIWDAGERYRAEQGIHPVIYLALGSARGATWEESRNRIADVIGAEYQRHAYVLEGDAVGFDRARFERLAKSEGSDVELASSLARLAHYLCKYHGTKAVILIDEYDSPVTEGYLNGYCDEAVEFMRTWLTDALKATTSLYLACLTGVQRVSRESIFSGLNNMVVNTALDETFTEGFWFTREEAQALLDYVGAGDRMAELRDWYDGYCFGGVETFNPWSVLNYVGQGCIAQPYWGNTSDNAIVHQLFRAAGDGDAQELRDLAAGAAVREPLDLSTVFSRLGERRAPIWSQLYLAGYLTTDDAGRSNDNRTPRELRIPNREVAWLYRDEFSERSEELAGTPRRLRDFQRALTSGDEQSLACCLEDILKGSASFFDLKAENSYHMLLLGLVYSVPGYRFPLSNRECGSGRPDITLVPEREGEVRLPAIVIEVKKLRGRASGQEVQAAQSETVELADLGDLASTAVRQAADKEYAHGLAGKGALVWGVAFSEKRVSCLARRQE